MRLAITVLALGVSAWGQKYCVGGEHPKNDPDCIPASKSIPATPMQTEIPIVMECPLTSADGNCIPSEAKPLKCPKYQHADYPGQFCGDSVSIDDHGKLHNSCYAPRCMDDLHIVTEREWQELMARMKKLERENAAVRGAGLSQTRIAEQCLHDLGVCTDKVDAVRQMVQKSLDDLAKKGKP